MLYSHRTLYPNYHFRLGLYEFEDVIRDIDDVDVIAPQPTSYFEYGTRVSNRLASNYDVSINPGVRHPKIARDYDLFFVIAQFARDLLHVKYLDGWRDRCRTSVCWLNEFWVSDIPYTEHFLRLLSTFDYVIVHWAGSVRPVRDQIGKPCFYQPYGINALAFCPYPEAPRRVIDVYSIGRRSEPVHRALLQMARERRLFYVYDSITGSQVARPEEHRALFANMAQRSRYFTVNAGKANVNTETEGQVEFGNRFFEGLGAGTIMIGEAPRNEQFDNVFDWPDAVIDLPKDSEGIATVLSELDADPERRRRIRTTNVIKGLERHDWQYRWKAILDIAGLQPAAGYAERKRRLDERAAVVREQAAREPLV